MKIKLVAATLLLISLCGCSTLVVHLPVSRFDSPEVPGESWKKNLSFGLGATHDVTIAQDASQRPPTIGTPTTARNSETPIKFSLGLWERLEVGLRAGVFNAPFLGYAKFQILGDPENKTHAGNFSLSICATAGASISSGSGDQQAVFGPGGFPWKANTNTSIQDFAAIIGYRVSDSLLIYGGPFISKYSMTGSIHDDLSSNGASPAADYQLSGSGQNTGGNLAMKINTSAKGVFSITAEGVASTFAWSNIATTNDIQGGLLLNWYW